MKKILLIAAAGFLTFGTVAASAADIAPVVAKAPPPLAPVYDPWTGIYIGGNFGSGLSNFDFSGTTTGTLKGKPPFQETFNGSRSQHGWLGGGQIGINYEIMPRLVVGVEGDIDWSNIKGSVSACSSKNAAKLIDCATSAGKIDDFGTVRGRVGYVFDNLLVFGSGRVCLGARDCVGYRDLQRCQVSQTAVGCARTKRRLVFCHARRLGGRGRI